MVHILKAKREPPTLRLKKLIESLSEYKFNIYFLKGKEMHISDFLSRHPVMMKIHLMKLYQFLLCCKSWRLVKFPDHLLYLKEEVGALPEQDNYVPYHEDDFMFLFSDDKPDNMSLLSELYSSESTRIEWLNVCKRRKKTLT